MNEINFLPASYKKAIVRRRRTFKQVGVFIGLALCLVGWFCWADARLDKLEEYAVVLSESADTVRAQTDQVELLRAEHGDLGRQLSVYRKIVQPVTPSQVIAAVGQMMPEAVTLSNFSVMTETLSTQTRATGRRGVRRTPAGGPGGATSSAMRVQQQSRVRVVMTGLAPSDMSVADFVGRLSGYPIFSKVKMRSSRTVYIRGLIAREFRIEAEVPLDRVFLPGKTDGEVAHVG